MITGGGLVLGHQHMFWGNEQAGKSASMLQTIGVNQARGVPCGYIDTENSFDKVWAGRLGVDVAALPVSRVSTVSDVTDLTLDWIHAGMQLIVIDSISQLMPRSFYSKDGEIKPFEETGQIGQQARELGQMCRMIQGENYNTAIVFTSQVRMDLSGFMPGMKPSGGKEVGHDDVLRVRLFSSKSDKQALTGPVMYGEQLLEEVIGRKVTWTIDKNKINGKYGTGDYDLYTQGDSVGIDRAGELLDYGIKYGIVKKGGAWISVGDERLQGRPKAVQYLQENPSVAEEIEGEILGLYQSL